MKDRVTISRLKKLAGISADPVNLLMENSNLGIITEAQVDPNQMSEEEQIEYVQSNWRNIENIHNPGERVQQAAVYNDMYSIFHIENLAPSVQKYAILSNTFALKYIKNLHPAIASDPQVKQSVIRYLLTLLKSDEVNNSLIANLLDEIGKHNLGWPELEVIKSAVFRKQIDDK